MTAYYNEIDPVVAQWLRNLIAAGLIAPGDVDERSIEDVRPTELVGYTQCHFFAGIGVWSYALRRAGWPDDRPVWTGSCPCQPFSTAGEGKGFADERHLWPAFFHLIGQRRPAIVFGEQVSSKDAEPWIDLVCADVESLGYAFGALAFPAAGVGCPGIRDRVYWLADTAGEGWSGRSPRDAGANGRPPTELGRLHHVIGLGDADGAGLPLCEQPALVGAGRGQEGRAVEQSGGAPCGVADADISGREQVRPIGPGGSQQDAEPRGTNGRPGPVNGFWRDADWLRCTDGRWRPVEPGTFPLAARDPGDVGQLRAYGNSLNAEAARIFIESLMS